MIHHFIEKKAVGKMICKDLPYYSMYNFSYNKNDKILCKPNSIPHVFKIKINISKYDKYINVIGSFIKTIVNFFDKINPQSILLVIDMSHLGIYDLCIKQFINKLIWSSTGYAFFIDLQIMVNPQFLEIEDYIIAKPHLDKIGINIITQDLFVDLLPIICANNKYQEYNHNNYLYFDYIGTSPLVEAWAFIIYYYATRDIIFEKSSTSDILSKHNFNIIAHIEKISNVHRLYNILHVNNMINNCRVYIEYSKNDCIINLCNQYGITIIDNIDSIKNENLIAIDLDLKANIIYQHNINKINNTTLVFGFESNGIPHNLLKLCKNKMQLKSRYSIDVTDTMSTIISLSKN